MSLGLRGLPQRTYTITQLCREFGATPRALRFYEEQDLLTPARREMARDYSHKDRARLQLILNGRRVGLSITEIREILDLYDESGEVEQSAHALSVFRRRIAELEAQRVQVDEAIGVLNDAAVRLAQAHGLSLDDGHA